MQGLRTGLTPWRALLLAALLLAAQLAGLVHRVAHGPAGYSGAPVSVAVSVYWGHAAPHAHDHPNAHGHAHGHPASETLAECRLYDQLLGHADVLIGTVPAATAPVPVTAVLPRDRACSSRLATAAYQARAPPLA